MKYNCPIVLLQDSYLKSFYFQPTPYFHGLWRDGLGKVDFQVGWLLVWVWFFFSIKMLVKKMYTQEKHLTATIPPPHGRPCVTLLTLPMRWISLF